MDLARRLSVPLPLLLLGLLFVLLGLFIVFGADAYGRTWDEGLQNWYGHAVYEWYRSGGNNIGFIRDSNPREYMPQHGPFAEVVIAAVQDLTGEQWRTRSAVCGVMGVLGVAAIALCGNELAGRWGALLAAIGLTLYPRYTGAIFNNSKDVPFTAAMTFVLWASLRLVRRWERGNRGQRVVDGAVLGLCLGVAASIRVSAVIWYGVLAVAAGWWLWRRRGRWADVAMCALAVCGVSYLAMLALWPYVFLNPVSGIVESIRAMAAYEWVGPIMLGGEPVRATELPWNYAPEWLVVGSPPVTVALALVGVGFAVADLVRGRAPVAELLAGALQAELPPGFRHAEDGPDFFVESEHAKPPSGYTPVHEVVVEGTVVCTIHARRIP